MKVFRILVSTFAALTLNGCWNGKAQFDSFLREGQARHVPLIIYDISSNDPHHLYPETFAIALLNTEDQDIASVKLTVAFCGIKAAATNSQTIDLGGPFKPHTASILSLLSDPDKSGHQDRLLASHMLITAVTVEDATGTKTFDAKGIVALLDSKIANFCASDII